MDQTLLYLSRLVSALLLPPGLFILLGIWVLLSPQRSFRIRVGFGILPLVGVLLLSLPVVSGLLQSWVETRCQALPNQNAEAIVILGGGLYRESSEYGADAAPNPRTLERLRYGATLHQMTGLPILVSGGAVDSITAEATVMNSVLENEFQVPVRWIESESLNTSQNAAFSWRILRKEGIQRILLVSHGWHLPRALKAFEAAGFEVTPAATVCGRRARVLGVDFIPTTQALLNSHSVLREVLGSWVYRIQAVIRQTRA
jgi:uncharacterized SAM-binding protein YcdF (DUF218 family)